MNKIILAISVVVNLLLIAFVVGLLPFLLSLSIVIAAILLWYIKKLTSQMNNITENFDELYSKIESYEQHVESVHSLEMFYGDQTLQALVDHAKSFDEQLDTFEFIYTLTDEEEENPPDDDTDTASEET